MVHPFASTEGTLPDPICLLCGVEIHTTDKLGIPASSEGASGLDKQHWKRLWKPGPGRFLISSDEVENAYIDRFPLLWSCLYRALIKDSDTRYHLTGINSIQHSQGPHYAVNDPTKARITGNNNLGHHTQMFTQFYAADIKRQPRRLKDKTIGFVIHAHCWTLFDQVGGLGFNNTELAKLVRICRKYWRESEWWGLSSGHPLGVSQSPLIVPAIQQAIASTKTDYYHPTSGLGILPLELRVLISEFICPITDYTMSDVQNLRNMLLGFGWELPKWFWRVRLDERLFFELKYSEDTSADWKLRLELMSLVADRSRLGSSGLANRERIIGIMLALRDAYTK
ncbi:unnamed protein product [Penicillium camemberti]|uniref:Str. FM013 n=1 Tax=Penicillium camemberti (strain FM 013) TaxID=1429867 RepID=A0A0G4PKE4_PENC3|nr:unnamed protein product [Penicillium camemberti]